MANHSPSNVPDSVPERDPIGARARQIITLFVTELASVKFPDVDQASVRAIEKEVIAAELDLESKERALADARRVLAERSEQLRVHLDRGLAYARVFATEPGLVARVSEIDGERPRAESFEARADKGKKRRGRRSESQDLDLLIDPHAEPESDQESIAAE